jgi:hypothetical protein
MLVTEADETESLSATPLVDAAPEPAVSHTALR